MRFSDAINGFLLFANARRLSPKTITDYHNTYAKLGLYLGTDPHTIFKRAIDFKKHLSESTPLKRIPKHNTFPEIYALAIDHDALADPLVDSITSAQIQGFLGGHTHLRKKTVLNYHTALSSFFNWAKSESLIAQNPMGRIPAPKPEKTKIIPYSQTDIESLLKACRESASYTRPGKVKTTHTPTTSARNRAIVLALLDTGLRSSELCNLRIQDMDLKGMEFFVRQGKGGKDRNVYFSARTGKAIWRYHAGREHKKPDDPVFGTIRERFLTIDSLNLIVSRLCKKAGIKGNVHKFRHTFALACVNQGMNAFVLQKLLGHGSMDMVRRYLDEAQIDLQNGYRSPVDSWKL